MIAFGISSQESAQQPLAAVLGISGADHFSQNEQRRNGVMVETREDRQTELQGIKAKDYIRLIRIYQDVIGTPHGQIPIPGLPPSRMIEGILKKEFPFTTTSRSIPGVVAS